MYYAYSAVFYPEEDGRYSVIFPDLNDLATYPLKDVTKDEKNAFVNLVGVDLEKYAKIYGDRTQFLQICRK